MEFPRALLAESVATLAKEGVYVGTSSWKYEGWLGMIYTEDRYRTRGKLSRAKFEKTCLYEYGQVFKSVCLDAGFYQFPSAKMLDGYFSHVPPDFRMSIKVTEDITVRKFPNAPRYGKRAGTMNERFLDADLFIASFLGPLEPYKSQIGTLIFEFGHFHPGGPVGTVLLDHVIQKYLSFARNFAVLKWNPWMEVPTIRVGDVLAVVIVLAA